MANNDYDGSWDLVKSSKGNLPVNQGLFDKKYQQWKKRDWMMWLEQKLTFPFEVERMESGDVIYHPGVDGVLFSLGHKMTVLGLEFEDYPNGIIVKVQEEGQFGGVPLCDLQVISKTDENYWPVREYVVWFANKSY